MPRNIQTREWLEARKKFARPQGIGRTQESLDAEARVRARARATTGISFSEDDWSSLTNQDWINIDKNLTFESPGLGRLMDIEENRLAAKAYDEMGWPMEIMTGCSKDAPSYNSCGLNLRQMAHTRYNQRVHRQPIE